MKDLFSIGDAADYAGITRKIILNYEVHGLITPDIKDKPSGNRYYTIDTLTKIRTIRSLQNLGLSLNEISNYFNDSNDLIGMIRRLETLRDELNTNIKSLYERINQETENIEEIILPSQTVFCRNMYSDSIKEKTDFLRNVALEAFHTYGSTRSGRIYFTECPLDNINDMTFFSVVPSKSHGEHIMNLPSHKAICIYYHGAYEELYTAHKTLLDYANEHQLTPTGIFRHSYLEGPPQHSEKSKFITQVALLIE